MPNNETNCTETGERSQCQDQPNLDLIANDDLFNDVSYELGRWVEGKEWVDPIKPESIPPTAPVLKCVTIGFGEDRYRLIADGLQVFDIPDDWTAYFEAFVQPVAFQFLFISLH